MIASGGGNLATGKVNKRSVDALKPGPASTFLWDDELKGFGVKLTPAGALSYVLQYRMGGREARTQRYSIGGHGNPWTPATARTEAERLLMMVAQGIDPSKADKKRRDDAVMATPPAVKARDRWLSDDELARVWNAAPACHRCFGPIVRLLIATGQRREEVGGLDWSELNRADRLWRIPGSRTKNGEPTTVPLNDLAVAELDGVAIRLPFAAFRHPGEPQGPFIVWEA